MIGLHWYVPFFYGNVEKYILVHTKETNFENIIFLTIACQPGLSLQSTLYSLHSTVYTLQSTLYSLHSTVYTLQSTLYSLHWVQN